MRQRSRAGLAKARRRRAPAAKRCRRVETIRGVTSRESKEELRFALLRRTLSEERRHHRRAKDALRESEHKLHQMIDTVRELRQMIDTIPIPVASYGADHRRDFVNAAWKEYTGLSGEAALGTVWSAVAHPDHIAPGEKMWRDALATGEPWHTEERVRRADGEYHWFTIDRVAARDENGKIIKWYGTAYDIEDRKRSEETLRRAEAWLAQAQRVNRTGTWVLNGTTRRFLYWSDESYRIWGFDPLKGLPTRDDMWERIHPDDRERMWKEVQEALREQRDFFEEFRILLPDGTVK
jgi:PAS domain S-box-containing protein